MAAFGNDTKQKSDSFDRPDSHRTLALEVEGRKFWISREILASYSNVFKAMLYGNFAEANENVVKLPGKKAEEIEELLRCLIPTPAIKKIDSKNLELILKLADEYQIDDLRLRADAALTTMSYEWGKSDGRLLDILRIASQYRMTEALKTIVKRCGTEFNATKLESIYKDLRVEVIAGLTKYVFVTPSEAKCRYQRVTYFTCKECSCQDRHSYNGLKCIYCGRAYCARCWLGISNSIEEVICNTSPENMAKVEAAVNSLLSKI